MNPTRSLPYWFIEKKDSFYDSWNQIPDVWPDTFKEAMDNVKNFQENGYYKVPGGVAWISD